MKTESSFPLVGPASNASMACSPVGLGPGRAERVPRSVLGAEAKAYFQALREKEMAMWEATGGDFLRAGLARAETARSITELAFVDGWMRLAA